MQNNVLQKILRSKKTVFSFKELILLCTDIEAKNLKMKDKKTSLHSAAIRGHCEVEALLLRAGAQVDAKDENNQTALFHAAIAGHIEIVSLLIAKGASIEACNVDNQTPLHAAASLGHIRIADLLLVKGHTPKIRK